MNLAQILRPDGSISRAGLPKIKMPALIRPQTLEERSQELKLPASRKDQKAITSLEYYHLHREELLKKRQKKRDEKRAAG